MTNEVLPRMSSRMAVCTFCSVSVSTLLVASSRMSIGASHSIARAMVRSCFCPLLMFVPSSLMTVSYPLGRRRIASWMRAAFAARTTSSIVAPSRP